MTSQSMENNLAVVTLHDAAPAFSKRIFEYTDAFENLEIDFNVGLIPFYHHTEDLPRFPEFVDKIKSYKRCEIVLHGLYHEDRNGKMEDFYIKSKSNKEEKIRVAPHTRDPHNALKDQTEMIRELKNEDYTITLYSDLIQKLQSVPYTTI